VLLNKPSFGVGQELEIAASYGKPVILVVERGVEVSRMVSGAPLDVIAEVTYGSPEELRRGLDEALEKAGPAVQRWRERMANGIAGRRIGARLAEARAQRNYADSGALAEALGVSKSLVEAIE